MNGEQAGATLGAAPPSRTAPPSSDRVRAMRQDPVLPTILRRG